MCLGNSSHSRGHRIREFVERGTYCALMLTMGVLMVGRVRVYGRGPVALGRRRGARLGLSSSRPESRRRPYVLE